MLPPHRPFRDKPAMKPVKKKKKNNKLAKTPALADVTAHSARRGLKSDMLVLQLDHLPSTPPQ